MKKTMKKQTILVTGGEGFIGSCLLHKLKSNSNYNLISLDNKSMCNNDKKRVPDGVTYINANCIDIDKFLGTTDINIIFHFGEYSRIPTSYRDIQKVIQSNVLGTAAVFAYAVERKCRFIYAATSSGLVQTADKSPYTITKDSTVRLLKELEPHIDININICYFYNVYGDGESTFHHAETVVGKFKSLFLDNKALQICGNGKQERDFTHVSDVVDGLARMLTNTTLSGTEYHFGYGKMYSILDIANAFKTEITFISERMGETKRTFANKETAYRDLKWSPKVDVLEHIQEFITKSEQ